MTLLYDLIASQPKKGEAFHGGGFYAALIFRYLSAHLPEGSRMVAFYDRSRPVAEDVKEAAETGGILLEGIDSVEEVYGLIEKHQVSRVFSAIPSNLRSLRLENVHFVFTNHGLRGIEKHWDSTEFRYTSSVKGKLKILAKILLSKRIVQRKVDRYKGLEAICSNYSVISVSRHSQSSIFLNLGMKDPDRIKVFYSPLFLDETVPEALPPVVEGDYFLIVSGNRWIKNSYRALLAFKNLQKHYPHKTKLVVTGIPESSPLRKWGGDNILMMDYVDDATLQSLYQHCSAFLYPTLNEGFGYPPLEAQRYSRPVISAANTSLFEVLGSSALFFDTSSVLEMETRLFQFLRDPELQNSLGEEGFKNYKRVLALQSQDLKGLRDFLFS
ncbi:MAG: glycosyltransferase [Spirochaetales bacterium]|nr:glycosyltransferase [Spirochaetales bacterium]